SEGGRMFILVFMSLRRKLARVRTIHVCASAPNTLWTKLIQRSPRRVRLLRTSVKGVKNKVHYLWFELRKV
ncbi:hypothetical protein EDD85DRAFT_839698, partial [Armillaria nabsnona]